MKTISFTVFRKNASSFIAEVEHGETIVLLRRGKPVAEVSPYSDKIPKTPAWKKSATPLKLDGSDLSSAILDERESMA
ncbi:MAG: type II toxin-antitoxin system Phd/YefM family antitoxin [Thermodesulfobacteriota bacterium]